MQSAGQGAGFADAARHAVLHRAPQFAQAGADLVLAAPGLLVREHQLRDRQAAALALLQQFRAVVERPGQFGGVGDDAVFRGFVLVDHETAADRIVVARGDLAAVRIVGDEAHAVGVERQLLPLVHHQVGLLVEGDFARAGEADRLAAADAFQRGGDDVGIDQVRPMAFQSHQHCLVGAVAAAGQGQRTEYLGAHPRHVLQAAGFGEVVLDETRGGAHRPDRMRGARADADLVQVEGGNGHAGLPGS